MFTRRQKLALSTLGILVLIGCSQLPHGSPRTEHVQLRQDAVVTDAGQGGDRGVAINLLPPKQAGFDTQAIIHRWVDNDIYQYEVTLKIWNGSSFVDFAPPLTVVVPRKVDPKTKAVFTNLRQGELYLAEMIAKGNVGGTAASTLLTSIPATASFDFSAYQDVEDTLSANLQVTFDAVAFSGTGTTTIITPLDGQYQNPTASESGTAQ